MSAFKMPESGQSRRSQVGQRAPIQRGRRLIVPQTTGDNYGTPSKTTRCPRALEPDRGFLGQPAGIDGASYRTHTLRQTKATLIYRRTKNLRAVQLLLGHTKLESTVRYLGIEVSDALEMAEQTDV